MKTVRERFETLAALLAAAILAAGVSASGCGKKADTDGDDAQNQGALKVPVKGLSDAQKMAQQGEVTCKDPANCSDSVAMVVSAEDDSVNMCSGFLIADDVLVTNSHCVPAAIRGQDSACKDQIQVYFPKTGKSEALHVDCGKIVFASLINLPDQYTSPDYAYIKLAQPTGRAKLEISTSGLADAAPVTVLRMNPKSTVAPIGEIDSVKCRVVQKSYALPQFENALNPVVTIGDCKLSHGNLGAPVLDEKGLVRAIAHGSLDLSSDTRYSLESRAETSISDLAYATNFACAFNPYEDPNDAAGNRLPKACTADLSNDSVKKLRQDIVNGRNPDLHVLEQEAAFTSWARKNSSVFQWELNGELPIPSCLNHPEKWIGTFRRAKGVMQMTVPRFESSSRLNGYLQRTYYIRQASLVPVQFTVDAASIRKIGSGEVKMESPDRVEFDDMLTSCE